ncbi:MAG: TMAO reductase system periplasmic protein TorT [Rhodospirillales bacterium]|nr:TMAO reductase system periplasmic protein TorT [Rhodospirillales bacterium]
MKLHSTLAVSAAALTLVAGTAFAQDVWYPYPVESWSPAFDMASPRTTIDYTPLKAASQPWEICVSFPHMKDAYWLGVNYGVADEAERLGVKMQLVEAGGYTELNTQISQIEDCVAAGADAVVIGAISLDGLNNLVSEIRAEGIPVIDVINGISSDELTAKSLVSFGEMGSQVGAFLADLYPEGADPVQVAWFPGPAGAGWVEAGNTGFLSAVEGSAVEVLDTRYGDTGREAQANLVEDALETYPELDYIVGTAVTAEAAVPILRSRNMLGEVQILSYYYTPGVDTGIARGHILAAPTDSPVIQGRIAIDIAVRALEGEEYEQHVGPALRVVTQDNHADFDTATTLAPEGFSPIFRVE